MSFLRLSGRSYARQDICINFLLYDPYDASMTGKHYCRSSAIGARVMINHMVSDPVRAITRAKRENDKGKVCEYLP